MLLNGVETLLSQYVLGYAADQCDESQDDSGRPSPLIKKPIDHESVSDCIFQHLEYGY